MNNALKKTANSIIGFCLVGIRVVKGEDPPQKISWEKMGASFQLDGLFLAHFLAAKAGDAGFRSAFYHETKLSKVYES
ncbi:conserved hypothetical protein [delta proteobacterium NaphS2]|nr:conserved hypothetical protein [delta proteobacterium NaphS2]